MNETKAGIKRGIRALHEHKALRNKADDSVIIEAQIAAFLSKGGEIEEIPTNLERSAEEISLVAASLHTSRNKQQHKVHLKRQEKYQGERISLAHKTKRAIAEELAK